MLCKLTVTWGFCIGNVVIIVTLGIDLRSWFHQAASLSALYVGIGGRKTKTIATL